MTEFETRKLADQILSRLPRNPNAPHYTDDSFRCKIRTAQRRAKSTPVPRPPESMLYLFRMEWAGIVADAKLTCRQMEVINLRLAGKTFEEIGAISGCSKQAILNILQQATKKIHRCEALYPYTGLMEVYRSETNRGRRMNVKGKLIR